MSMTQSGAQQHNAWLITLYGAEFKFVQVEIFCRGQKIKKRWNIHTHTYTKKHNPLFDNVLAVQIKTNMIY